MAENSESDPSIATAIAIPSWPDLETENILIVAPRGAETPVAEDEDPQDRPATRSQQ